MLLATGCKKPEQGAAGLPAPAQTASDKDLVASESGINVRSGPGAEYGVVFKLSANQGVREISRNSETVKVGKFEGQWVNIETNGQKGWVLSAFLVPKSKSVSGLWVARSELGLCSEGKLKLNADQTYSMTLHYRRTGEIECGSAKEVRGGQWALHGEILRLEEGQFGTCLKIEDGQLKGIDDNAVLKANNCSKLTDYWNQHIEFQR